MTCENLEQALRHAVTLWQAASLFLGLCLCSLSIGLGIGVDTSFICQALHPIFRRSHIQCHHPLRLEVVVVEPCSGLCSELRVRVGKRGKQDVLRGVGRGAGE